jgi:F420-dependent oxidoreductase-like protein
MRLGYQFQTFNDDPAELGANLARMARAVEEAGFDSIWTMDHLLQLDMLGPVDSPMVEAYTTLAFMAAHTNRVTLGTLVTGPMYRHPGMLIKQITSLDVLSGGRAVLGIGASWYEREHLGFGIPFPDQNERFERLEEILQIAHRMWSGDRSPFVGHHYKLDEPVNMPAALSKPRPKILIGGGGEQKTLRFVAKYGDACNIYVDSLANVKHKLEVLRERCDEIGRPFDEIERTAIVPNIELGEQGEHVSSYVEQLGALAEIGIQAVYGCVVGRDALAAIDMAGRELIPRVNSMA